MKLITQKQINKNELKMLKVITRALESDLDISKKDLRIIKKNSWKIKNISNKKIADELIRILLTRKYRRALESLRDSGLLREILPEIYNMIGCDQNPDYHLEGDVFNHTILVMESLPDNASYILILAALLHDVGKPVVSKIENGVIRSKGHSKAGADLAIEILTRFEFPSDIKEKIVKLVYNHMKPYEAKIYEKIYY